jgi:hypothetical protein
VGPLFFWGPTFFCLDLIKRITYCGFQERVIKPAAKEKKMKFVKVKAGKYKSENGSVFLERDAHSKPFRQSTWRAFCKNFKEIASSDSLGDLKAQIARLQA